MKEPYPDIHPKKDEIAKLKSLINVKYRDMRTLEEVSRNHYREAMKDLKLMGECHEQVHDYMKQIVDDLDKMKDIIDSPNFS